MEFRIHKRGFVTPKIDAKTLDIARRFTTKIHKEFGDFLKIVVLFGSSGKDGKKGDIDLLVVIDDLSLNLTNEVAQTYRIILEKTIADVSTKLHITTLKLTSFWEYVRLSDPVAVNILRSGVPLIDTGIFAPLRHLLEQGNIRPSKEAIWVYLMKAPAAINSSQANILRAMVDLYWAVMDSSHAALMSIGEVPPTPEDVPKMLREKLVSLKVIPRTYPGFVQDLYVIMKKIEHREISHFSGVRYDKFHKDTVIFVNKMQGFIKSNNYGKI